MASSGPLSVGTVADDSGVGTVAWVNPSNATASDNTRTTATVSGGSPLSHYLKATNCGFAIPAGATINGIVVEVEKQYGGVRAVSDNRARIVKGGTIGSTDKAIVGNWVNGTDTYSTYGTSSDLWGESWTYSDINASTFGFALACKCSAGGKTSGVGYVDHIRITVYYTAAVGGTTRSQCVVV